MNFYVLGIWKNGELFGKIKHCHGKSHLLRVSFSN